MQGWCQNWRQSQKPINQLPVRWSQGIQDMLWGSLCEQHLADVKINSDFCMTDVPTSLVISNEDKILVILNEYTSVKMNWTTFGRSCVLFTDRECLVSAPSADIWACLTQCHLDTTKCPHLPPASTSQKHLKMQPLATRKTQWEDKTHFCVVLCEGTFTKRKVGLVII